jgi:hypothetical protein
MRNVAGITATISAVLLSTYSYAFNGEIGPLNYRLSTVLSAGAAWRMEKPDENFIGRTNLPGQENFCQASATDPVGTCVVGGHDEYLAGRGNMGNNADNGNMNFDEHDLTFATAKFTSDLELNWGNSGAFFRFYGFKDWAHDDRKERHWNTIFQPAETALNADQEEDLVSNVELLDAYIYHDFEIGDHTLSVKVGDQVISWGESLINVINSFNVISPPDAVKVRYPGMNLKEIFRPIRAIDIAFDFTENLSAEAFYQLKWNNVHIDPQGAFHSHADAAEAGGDYIMIDFGKGAEDPDNLNDSRLTFADPVPLDQAGRGCFAPGSASETHPYGFAHRGGTLGRTVCREPDRTPSDDGQWGLALRYYAEWLNDTDIGFYYMNYHSRLPYGSFRATQTGVDLQAAVGIIPGAAELISAIDAATQALPIPGNLSLATAEIAGALMVADTMTLILDYPEDIEVYGFSFNTTFGDISVSAEYAHRPNLPVQIGGADLVYYALAPAFGDRRRSAIPSQVELYRNGPNGRLPEPGEFIPGYERLEVGQGDVVSIWATSNAPFWADQWIVIAEAGFTKIWDLPSRDELHFDGPNTVTHQSQGRDEAEAAFDANPTDPNQTLPLLVLNPQRQTEGWVNSFSWGYKLLSILDYPGLFKGFNVKQIAGFFHDVNGIGPSPAPTYVEGSKEILIGLDVSKGPWLGELRYKVHTGGGSQNPDSDRDELALAIKYSF